MLKTDALIAATAIRAGAEFLTLNRADFEPFAAHGLRRTEPVGLSARRRSRRRKAVPDCASLHPGYGFLRSLRLMSFRFEDAPLQTINCHARIG